MALQEEELHIEQVCINDILEQSLVGFYGVFMKKDITPDIQMPEIKIIRSVSYTHLTLPTKA